MPSFPYTRTRRLRKNSPIRSLVQEFNLSINDLIAPIFVSDQKITSDIIEMPKIRRYCLDDLVNYVNQLVNLDIKSIALFPVIGLS